MLQTIIKKKKIGKKRKKEKEKKRKRKKEKKDNPKDMKRKVTMTGDKATKVEMEPEIEYK